MSTQTTKDAQTKLQNEQQSAEEPLSGVHGKGVADQPYDQGNQAEQSGGTTEPPAGDQGAGTADKAYDQGNQPEQNSSSK